MTNFFTSESVTEGHPDKISDQISDAILDAIIAVDKEARVACETFVTTNFVLIGGEISTTAKVDYKKIAKDTIKNIGYVHPNLGFNYQDVEIQIKIHQQSPDISQGVDKKSGEIGAGDQGIMFGYATNETKEFMPLPIITAHKLAEQLSVVRKDEVLKYLRPDGKTQVTFEFDENNKPIRIDTILISTQHSKDITLDQIKEDLLTYVINPVVDEKFIDDKTKFLINPTGIFIIGGPTGDAGLTGRKIIVDSYGGSACHGGGAFSGKDYTKVDRSGAYICRYLAKNIVASGVCDKIQIQLSYAIGVAQPTSISIDTYNTNCVDHEKIINTIYENFNLSPQGIVETLNLKSPIYLKTASYGHFGKKDLPWEELNCVDVFRKLK